MSKEAVQMIIGKAVTDSEFRRGLFANSDEVLAGFELTDKELAALKAIDVETMDSLAGTLDERISKAYEPWGGFFVRSATSEAYDIGGVTARSGEPPVDSGGIPQHYAEHP